MERKPLAEVAAECGCKTVDELADRVFVDKRTLLNWNSKNPQRFDLLIKGLQQKQG